jgi:heptosyltransferase-3
MTEFRNILLIQLGDIGDVVLTTPTIRAVKETYPEARITMMARKPFGNLLLSDPSLYEVIETEKIRGTFLQIARGNVQLILRLRRARYDLVIDLRIGDRGAILAFLTGASARIACQGGNHQFWRDILFTKILRDMKIATLPIHPGADQSLRIVRELGIDTADSTPKLYIAPDDLLRANTLLVEAGIVARTKIVTVNPFSRWKYKEWNNAKWGEAIDRIWETRQIASALIGSAEEAASCQEIVAGREERVINLAGKTTLGELAAVISLSSLHLGVDSAAPHIAAALGIPTVTIHGPSDWRAWRIVDEHHKVISPVMDCLPCNMTGCDGSGKSRCLDELAVEPVICAALELLGGLHF